MPRLWAEEVVSIVSEMFSRALVGAGDGIINAQCNWGLPEEHIPAEWPVRTGKWIVSSGYSEKELMFPSRENLYGFIPLYQDPYKSAAAVCAVLYGWKFSAGLSSGRNADTSVVPHPGIDSAFDRHALPEHEKDPDREYRDSVFVHDLSERELEVAEAIASGESNKLIAAHLGISESTVKFHIRSLSRKLDVHNRAQIVSEALRRGLLIV